MSVCCFTGHREIAPECVDGIYHRLLTHIEKLIQLGVREFRTGGALGFDTLAALAVLQQRERYPDIRLVLMLPCQDQASRWSVANKMRYQDIIQRADDVTVLAPKYYRGCMFARNRALVEGSKYCICYLTGVSGGTAMTVDYATKKGLKIINVGEIK